MKRSTAPAHRPIEAPHIEPKAGRRRASPPDTRPRLPEGGRKVPQWVNYNAERVVMEQDIKALTGRTEYIVSVEVGIAETYAAYRKAIRADAMPAGDVERARRERIDAFVMDAVANCGVSLAVMRAARDRDLEMSRRRLEIRLDAREQGVAEDEALAAKSLPARPVTPRTQVLVRRPSRAAVIAGLAALRRGEPEAAPRDVFEIVSVELCYQDTSVSVELYPISPEMRAAEERCGGRVTAKGCGLEPVDQKWLRTHYQRFNNRQLTIAKAFADAVCEQMTAEERRCYLTLRWRTLATDPTTPGRWEQWVAAGKLAAVEAELADDLDGCTQAIRKAITRLAASDSE